LNCRVRDNRLSFRRPRRDLHDYHTLHARDPGDAATTLILPVYAVSAIPSAVRGRIRIRRVFFFYRVLSKIESTRIVCAPLSWRAASAVVVIRISK